MLAAERKTLETAIQCLEMAVHPRTVGGEVGAAIDGWRRKVGGKTVEEICEKLYDERSSVGVTLPEYRQEWAEKLKGKQERINTLLGENIQLRRDTEETKRMLTRLRQELAASQNRTPMPVIEPPKPEPTPEPPPPQKPVVKKTPTVHPVSYTAIQHVRFGDTVWEDVPSWNKVRVNLIRKLLDDGLSFQQVNQTLVAIQNGKRTTGNYTYDETHDISIKTRSANEVYTEVKRTAVALKMYCEAKFSYPMAVPERAKATYPDGLAFPNETVLHVLHDPDAPESPAPIPDQAQSDRTTDQD